jgi:hypothetical protein
LALINYADRSAFDLFKGSTVEPLGDQAPHEKLPAYARTQQNGITKTDAHRLFGNKRKAVEIDGYFDLLTVNGFGRWEGARWLARGYDGSTGGGVASQTPPATCEGEARNGTEAVKEGL